MSAAKRKESQQRYNARRRARYAATKLEKQAQLQTGKNREQTLKQLRSLKKAIDASYIDKKTKQYKQTITQLESKTKTGLAYSQKLAARTKQLSEAENKRRTAMQVSYFKQAAKTEAQREAGTSLTQQQKLARAEQSFFYSATRVLWQGGSPEYRNENIVAGLRGVHLSSGKPITNLQDAVEYVKERYADTYPTMDMVRKGRFDTDTDLDFLGEVEEIETSPRPISRKSLRAAGAKF